MESITVKAFAKVNLCLDVRGLMDNGYHEVAMILQQIDLHDDVILSWEEAEEVETPAGADPLEGLEIKLEVSRGDVPADGSNLAWKAAEEMARECGEAPQGRLCIRIEKRIPMAAGLAGGSSDCAAVIHGLNRLWGLGMKVEQLCEVGARLGSDVPFCVMGQAAADPIIKADLAGDENAAHCAIARGRGTDMEPIPGLESHMALVKPDISVSTKEVYTGIDGMTIDERPDIQEMKRALENKDMATIEKNMVNVLEKFTLKRYSVVVYTKDKVQDVCNGPVLMSGSGPTIYCLCKSEEEARSVCERLENGENRCICTKTTF